jgi:hypothetical protein
MLLVLIIKRIREAKMLDMKKLYVCVIATALCAIGTGSASAAQFTSSATGSFGGHALENQVLTTNAGEVVCTGATSAGPLQNLADTQIHETRTYTGCKAFSVATVHTSPVTLTLTADGTVHVVNPITITPTLFGVSACTITIPAQTWTGIAYSNVGANNIKVTPMVTGIVYISTGGPCGASGSNGTLRGASELNRIGGGTLRFDP